MSKPSRRRQPQGSPAGTPPAAPGRRPSAHSRSVDRRRPRAPAAGRRERARAAYKPSFMERNRTPIVVLAAVAGIVLISTFVFASAASPAYACTQVWTPAATPSPAAGESPNPGLCPAGHGSGAPSQPARRSRTPTARRPRARTTTRPARARSPRACMGRAIGTRPEGWIHNLEHGAMVILYRGRDGDPGVTEAGQTALRELFDEFPASPICNIQPGTSHGSGDRPVRRHGDPVRGHGLGSGSPARNRGHGADPRVLADLGRTHQPRETVPAGRGKPGAER